MGDTQVTGSANPRPNFNPGSLNAIEAGCLCPRLDNYHGRGIYTDEHGELQFIVVEHCPIHGVEAQP